MNETLVKIFSNPDVAVTKMTLFSFWHILYVLIILIFPFVCMLLTKSSDEDKKLKLSRILAIAVFVVYIGDFFAQPFYNDGNLIVDKLPFHICTFLCPAIMLVQFSNNKRVKWFYDAVALLAIVAPFMYFVYPNTAFGDTCTPYCYRVLQTFVYHGLVYSWGMYALVSGRVKLLYDRFCGVLIIMAFITLWASFGNAAYDHNWYFLQGLDLGFVNFEFPITYLVMNAGVFLMVMIVFFAGKGIYKIKDKKCHVQTAPVHL